jgi:Flp pilus assembly protein TadG
MRARLRRIARCSAGVSALEFALVSPVLILMLIILAQFGILFFAKSGLKNLVADAARYATIYPRPTDAQLLNRMAQPHFGLVSADLSTPTISHGVANGTNYVDISVSYTVPVNVFVWQTGPYVLSEARRAYVYPSG